MSPIHNEDVRDRFVDAGAYANVAVVVVTYNSASDISLLIDDLRVAALDRPLRVIVVDNHSSDGTADIVRGHTDIRLIESGENLGYSGAINVGLRFVGQCDTVLILNPDLRLAPDTVTRLLGALDDDRIGAIVPLMLDEDGGMWVSLRREPSLTRAIGDAFLGSRVWRNRPGFLSEHDYRPASYLEAHDVDWATGAALLIPAAVVGEVGDWNEEFFLFSEETDYLRRIRECGRRIRFEPSAVVQHRRGGSGTRELATLMAVSRVRYAERHHGWAYSAVFRAVVALAELLRFNDPVHRHTLGVLLNRRRWGQLPKASKPLPAQQLWGSGQRGAVIVPAYNEEAVIRRTLAPLSGAAVDGFIELIVVCNGCTDNTAEVARGVPGVRVVELEQGSKPAALNAGDDAATLWPRLYLDADIQIPAATVLKVLDRLRQGDVLVARPESRYDSDGASALVRSYYRARGRIPQHKLAMWGAGVYGLTAEGHQRLGIFPTVTGDDLYVDTRFDAAEKVVVSADPSVVTTPVDAKSLLAILRRSRRGGAELRAAEHGADPRVRNTGLDTAVTVVRTIRGAGSAFDAVLYLGMALAARWSFRKAHVWERDESSRLTGAAVSYFDLKKSAR